MGSLFSITKFEPFKNYTWESELRRAILDEDTHGIFDLSLNLRSRQPEVNDFIIGENGETPVLFAVEKLCEGRISMDTLILLMKLGYHVNAKSENGINSSPLQVATRRNRLDVVKVLLEYGADPNFAESLEICPLTIACIYGFLDGAKVLLESGANPNFSASPLKGTPLHLTVRSGHKHVLEISRLLLDYGCDINQKNSIGRTTLHSLCESRRDVRDIVRFLLDNGINIDEKDNEGKTALTLSLAVKNMMVSQFLVENGANITDLSLEQNAALEMVLGMCH